MRGFDLRSDHAHIRHRPAPIHPFLDRKELTDRIAAVRHAKDLKARAGKGRDLSPEELAVVLPVERLGGES